MALDIRLDFMNNIKTDYLEKMTYIRDRFIDLDAELQGINDELQGSGAGLRAIALARTNLEQSLMYAIKTLCILGEK